MKRILSLALLLLVGFLSVPGHARAATAVTVTDLHLRAGPGFNYPVVTTVPVYADMFAYGCTVNFAWCDISWLGYHGWVPASYIEALYWGEPIVVTASVAPALGLGAITFSHQYWERYYSRYPWYNSWSVYHVAPAPAAHYGATTCYAGVCRHVGVNVFHAPPAAPVGHYGITRCANGYCRHAGVTVRPRR